MKMKNEDGMTLLELIVALSLFAIIAATAFSALMQIMSASKALDDERDVGMISNAVLSRLSRELQLMTPDGSLLPPAQSLKNVPGRNEDCRGTPETLKGGRSGDTITFIAEEAGQYVPDGQTHNGLVQITYRVEPVPGEENPKDEEIFYLIRDEVPVISPPANAYQLRMTFPITKRLVGLKFRYFDEERDEWTDTWDETRAYLPTIIHFVLKLRSPAGKVHTYASDLAIKRD